MNYLKHAKDMYEERAIPLPLKYTPYGPHEVAGFIFKILMWSFLLGFIVHIYSL